MKKILEMINTSPDKSVALETLNVYYAFGRITSDEYKKGKQLINNEFN